MTSETRSVAPDVVPPASALSVSAATRFAVAAALAAPLWLAVWWALT